MFSLWIGGFGGNVGHDAHLLYTLSAVQILAIFNALDRIDAEPIVKCKNSIPDGCFALQLLKMWRRFSSQMAHSSGTSGEKLILDSVIVL